VPNKKSTTKAKWTFIHVHTGCPLPTKAGVKNSPSAMPETSSIVVPIPWAQCVMRAGTSCRSTRSPSITGSLRLESPAASTPANGANHTSQVAESNHSVSAMATPLSPVRLRPYRRRRPEEVSAWGH